MSEEPQGYQDRIRQVYAERRYTADIRVLALGLCEEAGEVAAAILNRLPEYKAGPDRAWHDLEHELHDCLVYICAIANATDIDLGI